MISDLCKKRKCAI